MKQHVRLVIILAWLPAIVACGNGSHALSPTAPSAGAVTGTSINPQSATNQTIAPQRLNGFSVGARELIGHVEGEGVVSSLASGTACPALTFVIEGFTIKVSATTTYTGGACADIAAGTKLGVKGEMAPDRSVTASSITVKKASDTEKFVDGDGSVSSLVTGASCPTLSFKVEDHLIKLSASTTFEGGVCTDLKVGSKVKIQGTLHDDGSVTATRVVIKKDDTEKFVEGDGTVSSLISGTSCPALSFKIEDHLIKTSASTKFDAGTCNDIKVGSKLTIQGTQLGDGSVNATHIVLKGDHPTEVEGETRVSSLVTGTACPTLSFIVEGHTVMTTPTTVFNGGACADLKAGVRIQVKGLMTSGGTVTATAVMFKTEDKPQSVEDGW